jgi:hypothetical protein
LELLPAWFKSSMGFWIAPFFLNFVSIIFYVFSNICI